jgi:hypothetical protein
MKMRLFVIEAIVVALLGFSSSGFDFGGFQIGININPPPIEINGPPEVAVIPGTYVYFVPDVSEELFFYDGYWYRPYEGNWYRCTSYSGPWAYIDRERVPDVFFDLPSDYRAMSEYRRIPYGELSGNWRVWQREWYWDRVGWGRDREREHGVVPYYGYGGREREHGVAPEFRGGEGQNLGRSNEGGRQNMNWGEQERQRR